MTDRVALFDSRAAWLSARRGDGTSIGASEVAPILGVSPHRGPWDAWSAKTSGDVGDEPDVTTGEDAEAAPDIEDPLVRGNLWEPFARQLAGLTMAARIDAPGAPFGAPESVAIVRHADAPWAACSPDGWRDGAPVELKTDASRSGWGWGPSGTVIDDVPDIGRPAAPPHYLTQVWWQIECIGADCAYLVVVLGSYRVRWYKVLRNDEIQRQLLVAVGEWRERHLVQRQPPNIDASEACIRHYRAMYLGRSDGEREATPEEADAIRDLDTARRAAKAADGDARGALSRLLPAMGAASRLTLPDSRAYVTRDSRGTVKVWGNV